ncbi:hypothetical protein ACOMHN_035281 [Nucella lapillus]
MPGPQDWDRYRRYLTKELPKELGAITTAIYSISSTQLTRFCGSRSFRIHPEEEDGLRTLVERVERGQRLQSYYTITLNRQKYALGSVGFCRDENNNAQLIFRGKTPQVTLYLHLEEKSIAALNGSPLLFVGMTKDHNENLVRDNLTHTGQTLWLDSE